MKERGIIFNAEMVRAILDGRKTQMRRPAEFKVREEGYNLNFSGLKSGFYCYGVPSSGFVLRSMGAGCWNDRTFPLYCPFGNVGDRLWVRETWQCGLCTESTFAYRATHKPSDLEEGWNEKIKWRPSSQMPRWASRILLEITSVRVERLQDISQADAIAEGAPPSHPTIDAVSREYGFPDFSRSWFGQTWWHIYGKENWQANPWVWVIEFKQIQG
ncbi:hypothetical protein H9I30_17315 [Morganella morganii]|uniref:hypothetical protein n=1 Tax=Morganella morganii TaxID=582 RepID=UPI00165180E6|nr:hypothetical protein [Morganella morganii]MBC6659752.1 hypothetical protein [Morganella morganii]